MRYKRNSIFAAAMLLFVLFLFVLLFINADVAAKGVRRGIALCTETLIPSLFPFLVLSELLIALGLADAFKKLLPRQINSLLGVSSTAAGIYLLGILCGFPVGSTSAITLYERGELSKEELDRLMLFCNTPSSGFLIGTVGCAFFKSFKHGLALFFIILLSSLILALLLRVLFGKAQGVRGENQTFHPAPLNVSLFTKSVHRACSSLLQVCAFVIFFSCVGTCLSSVIEARGGSSSAAVLLGGFLEMTSGIQLANAHFDSATAFQLSALFASFSGLCILFQLFSVTGKYAPTPGAYFIAKLIQGSITFLLSVCYLRLFPLSKNEVQYAGAFDTPLPWNICVFSLLMLFLFLLFLKRKKRPLRAQNKKGS